MRSRFGLGTSEGRREARRGDPELRADDYRLLRDLVSERLGISFASESRVSLERRLRGRLTALGLASFSDYYQLLRYDPLAAAEWDEATELLTTHETYFFREDFQLRAFKDELLPMLADRLKNRRRLLVWSAGCSTGEEAYTVAMLVLESGLFDGWDVHIRGSDVSKRCIAAARRGIYGQTSFRATPEDERRKWFVPVQRGEGERAAETFSVSPAARTLCHFGQMNMLDEERTHLVGRYDVIFCRNVLIYFGESARRRVIEMFHERLNPGGVLLLGHAESLLNVSTAFELLHLKEDLVYRKPVTGLSSR
ncbi:MAG: protein-glutamate O-methyltransferase CheR [Polyangiaceae bacterium]|nr:protein-glutamate O-methyltransferase CheR [Polyangiaceae bacterium]